MCPICHSHSGLIAHCNRFKKIDQEVPQDLLDQLNAANQHKATVIDQKKAFDKEKEYLNTSNCLTIGDFKKKLKKWMWTINLKKISITK